MILIIQKLLKVFNKKIKMKKKKQKEMELVLKATANEERAIQEIYQNLVRKESPWCLSKTIPSLATVSSAKERQLQTAGAESTGLPFSLGPRRRDFFLRG